MKKIVSICAVCLFVCVAVAIRAQEMETKYFSLNLPDGWEEIKMPNQDAIPGVTKMFANKKANAAISVSCAESPENPRESAERIRAQMNKDGLKVGELEEKDGIYSYNFQKGPAKGWAYY
ncbi:MAG: hypothetical protein K2H64_05025, partial [Desulfovibrio sp.]|nr:hypothetical protein [Desulfovibrio sp.]